MPAYAGAELAAVNPDNVTVIAGPQASPGMLQRLAIVAARMRLRRRSHT